MGKEISVPSYVLDQLKQYIDGIDTALAQSAEINDPDYYNQGRAVGARMVLKLLALEV